MEASPAGRAHQFFNSWVKKVARWLETRGTRLGSASEWSSVSISNLVIRGDEQDNTESWREFREAVRKRLEWLGELAKKIEAAKEDGTESPATETMRETIDVSPIQRLLTLEETGHFDRVLKVRSLALLESGISKPEIWDSVVRSALLVLEERLRDVGNIDDPSCIGRRLVNRVFGADDGTLANKFNQESQCLANRDLFAGFIGGDRNTFAHTFVDPSPEDGIALIGFVNLLLSRLERLR